MSQNLNYDTRGIFQIRQKRMVYCADKLILPLFAITRRMIPVTRRQTLITALKAIFSRETPCCNLQLFEKRDRAHWVYQHNNARRTLEGAVCCLNKLSDW